MSIRKKNIGVDIQTPLFLADLVYVTCQAVEEDANAFEDEYFEVGKRSYNLCVRLFMISCLATTSNCFYDRPLLVVLPEVSRNLSCALKLVRKFRRLGGMIIISRFIRWRIAGFQRVFGLLDASIANLDWILAVFCSTSSGGVRGTNLVVSLPPITAKTPVISLIWSLIGSMHIGSVDNRIQAVKGLASFASGGDRSRRVIVEEGGIPPLLKLLKEGETPDAQIAAASVLCSLVTDKKTVQCILEEHGIPVIVQVLKSSTMKVQGHVANLISLMAEHSCAAQEEFATENVISALVPLMWFIHPPSYLGEKSPRRLYLSSIDEKMELLDSFHENSKQPYAKDPFMKKEFRVKCSKALRMLLRGSTSNCKRLIEMKGGLVCLANHIGKEKGEFRLNCLMSVMEVTKVAESDTDFCHIFISNVDSDAVRAVVDQVMNLIEQRESNCTIVSAAVQTIGSLAPIIAQDGTRAVNLLVKQLTSRTPSVAVEVAIALGKFVSPKNSKFVSSQHSKTMIKSNGVKTLMELVKMDDYCMINGYILICYLALHKECWEAMEEIDVLGNLESTKKCLESKKLKKLSSSVPNSCLLRQLLPQAIHHLRLYKARP